LPLDFAQEKPMNRFAQEKPMNRTSSSRTTRACSLFASLASLVLPACTSEGGAPVTSDTSDAGPPETGTDAVAAPGPSPFPNPHCGVVEDSGISTYENLADGEINGPDVSSTICNIEASVITQSYATFPTMTFLEIDSASAPLSSYQFQTPATASDVLVTGALQIASASLGVYTSSDPQNCGSLAFGFSLPTPAGVDCGDSGSPSEPSDCPAGCSAACSGVGCEPCTPTQPSVGYVAQGASQCFDVGTPGIGSWTITLTSVVPFESDAGAASGRLTYAVHGTLSAQLVGGDADGGAGSEPATLTLTF
jgi:hypothetical protein